MIKKTIKVICFLLGLGVILNGLMHVFIVSDFRAYHTIEGFYEEEEGALDAVYIGASNVYPFYEAPLAWKDHGIAVYPLSVANMKHYAMKYVIEEARKTQPDALYIVCLNNFKDVSTGTNYLHYLLDYMHFSKNKLDLISAVRDYEDLDMSESLELYFPFVRFHSGWNELKKQHIVREPNGYKSGAYYRYFLKNSRDVSASYNQTEAREPLSEELNAILTDLLDYCEEEQVNVLFVFALQMIKDDSIIAQFNTIEDIVLERGFPVMNAMDVAAELGLNYRQDYYNEKHLNVHGAIKMTDYMAQYLVENYGFTDKRGQSGYESWDKSEELYVSAISPFCFDFELDLRERDYSMTMPETLKAEKLDAGWTIDWSKVDGADGYYVYRKHTIGKKEYSWQSIAYTEELTYTDADIESGRKYAYTVVPVRTEGDTVYYGECHLFGVGDKNASYSAEDIVVPMDESEALGGGEV